ncbi:lactonase family protein [Pseudomonadota bacterium]
MFIKNSVRTLCGLIAACTVVPVYAGDNDYDRDYIYTISNGANNSVLGFSVEDDGRLIALQDSPFLTGGSGLQAPVMSQNAIVVDDEKKLMFAVNTGSRDISVMKIKKNGVLESIADSPFLTGGGGPLSSLALSGDVLYAAHNMPDFGYRGMRIKGSGSLTPIENAVYPLPEEPMSFPVAIEFNPAGDTMVALRFSFLASIPGSSVIETSTLDHSTGLLTPAPGSPYETSRETFDSQPLAFSFNPSDSSQIFVGNAVDILGTTGTVSSYLVAESGQIMQLENSPVDSGGNVGTGWIAMTQDGKHLYAINTASDTISHFSVDRAGKLTLLDVIDVLINNTQDAPRNVVFSDGDQYLYVLNGHYGEDGNGGSIVGFKRMEDGTLLPLPSNPLVVIDEQPVGLMYIKH